MTSTDYDFLPCPDCLATFVEGRRQFAVQALPFGSLWCQHRLIYAFANAGEVTFRPCASAEQAAAFDEHSRTVYRDALNRVTQIIAEQQRGSGKLN